MPRKVRPLWSVILADLLVTLLILAGWAAARWVGMRQMAEEYRLQQQETMTSAAVLPTSIPLSGTPVPETTPFADLETTPAPSAAPEGTPDMAEEPTPAPDEAPAGPTASPVDGRTPWQIRFAEYFTPTVERGDGYYSSPNVSVRVTRHSFEGRKGTTVYYVADIHIAHIECLRTWFAGGGEFPTTTGSMEEMSRDSGAVIAVNGDYCGFSYGGVVLRNGRYLYSQPTGSDACFLYRDGQMLCPAIRSFDIKRFGEDEFWQIWTFGPALLDGNGAALTTDAMNLYESARRENPRTALGYYEPGHYCFIVADGRSDGYSAGLWLDEFAQVCALTGCTQAYNLDGGGSSMMYMNGDFVNTPSGDRRRSIPDILLIADLDPPTGERGEAVE